MTDPDRAGKPSPEPQDFEATYRAHAAYVWQTLRRLGVRPADLEDATHDVFLVVHRRWSEYDSTRPIKPWLFGIAMRTALHHRRKAVHRREVASEDIDRVAGEAATPEADITAARRREAVIVAIQAINESRRDVFILHDLDGIGMPDIVRELGIPLNTGYSRLRLARAEISAALRAAKVGEEAP